MSFPIFVQLPLAIAGDIAAHFVSRDSVRFELVQTGIALVMLATFIILLICALRIWKWVRGKNGIAE
ncbi:hypothetical protein DTW90_03060 [Neorhizobium sp. P12A]|jgi:hypothetical protein|uniref:hypothetical protein n=1 Tax=Rhizobium/Agrobacterium group TaxID=227290 RepID=UPI001046A08B|nr:MULTISPECIES: hypothetical protein [Rhizobium/Agrobacterium group]KAA0700637.1 hypothetical protein DTW90_03060 [Neorhizobium sp. P12A]TCR91967.1 hypothetical protein EV561_102411 [Rhizobium sp. BK376]